MKFFWALALSTLSGSLYSMEPSLPETKEKTITVASSKGGGGHESALAALTDYLKGKYTIKTIYPFKETLSDFDPIKTMTWGAYSGEDFYNLLLRNRYNKAINWMSELGQAQIDESALEIEKTLTQSLQKLKPNTVVSIIPFINGPLEKATHAVGAQFVLIPTDLDATNFYHNIQQPKHKDTTLTLAFNHAFMVDKLKKIGINPRDLVITGFPVKKEFFVKASTKEKEVIRDEFKIPAKKPTVMILMGAAGSTASLDYAKIINEDESTQPLHAIICLGRNEELRQELEALPLKNNLTFSIIGNTSKIPQLMAVSHLILTKSGSVSVNEALKSKVPMIIDATQTPLNWEKTCQDAVKNAELGEVLTQPQELPAILKNLSCPGYREYIKKNMNEFDTHDFSESVKKLF